VVGFDDKVDARLALGAGRDRSLHRHVVVGLGADCAEALCREAEPPMARATFPIFQSEPSDG